MEAGLSAWGSRWGSRWGNAWGDLSESDAGVITGTLDANGDDCDVVCVGAIKPKAASYQYSGARPGGRHGIIPPTAFIVAEYQQQEIARQLARVISGDASAADSGCDASASGRVKAVKLVATVSAESTQSVDVSAAGVFVDAELEMMALLLAA